jgi:hypothetical protein
MLSAAPPFVSDPCAPSKKSQTGTKHRVNSFSVRTNKPLGNNKTKKKTDNVKMAKTLEKTRKQIAKKRNGSIEALHGKSRDSKRLHRAQVRDDRLEKIALTRRRQDKPLRSWRHFIPCRETVRILLTAPSYPRRLLPGRSPAEWRQAA